MTDLDDLLWFIFACAHLLKPPQANYGGRVTDVHDSLAPGNVQQPGMYTVDWSTVESSSHLFLIHVEKTTLSFLQFWLSRAMYQLPAFGLLLPRNLEGWLQVLCAAGKVLQMRSGKRWGLRFKEFEWNSHGTPSVFKNCRTSPISLSQWLTFELLGVTYLVGKIKFKLLFHGPKWLSKLCELSMSLLPAFWCVLCAVLRDDIGSIPWVPGSGYATRDIGNRDDIGCWENAVNCMKCWENVGTFATCPSIKCLRHGTGEWIHELPASIR